ncbi:MAG: NAD-dependent epimerase/dehydratase family protein [bacterium]|nr:NAD-dependent epimerase/dehydratase family protein [bacterium]
MKVLITGANGFVGSNLVRELLKKNYKVYCLVRKTSSVKLLSGLNISYLYGSIDDKSSLENAFSSLKSDFPEYIIHCAGVLKGRTREDFFSINAEGAKNIVEACLLYKEKIKRFVYISSLAASGPATKINPRKETDTPNAISFYGQSKLAGEGELKKASSQIPITILRPTAVYGPGDKGIYTYFKLINSGIMPHAGNMEMEISVIFVEDLVKAILFAMEKKEAAGEIYFVSDETVYKLKEILSEIKKTLDKKTFPLVVPDFLLFFVAIISEFISGLFGKATFLNRQKFLEIQQKGWVCSTDKLKQLGFKPEYDLKRGVEETVKWYRENGWL